MRKLFGPLAFVAVGLSSCSGSMTEQEVLSCLAFSELLLERTRPEDASSDYTAALSDLKYAAQNELAPTLQTSRGIYALADAKRNERERLTELARASEGMAEGESRFVEYLNEKQGECEAGLGL